MTVDLRHYDPSSENKNPGPPAPKGRPLWPIVVVIMLAAALYFGAKPSDEGNVRSRGPYELVDDSLDSSGTEGITFNRSDQAHYFRKNDEAGNILVISGQVRNGYPHRRSFIRLSSQLLTADGRSLADRYVFAGNMVSEKELVSLPIGEIYSRLSLRGGRDGLNVDIQPGQEIPFMFVFDKLPDGMAEFRIDPVGSDPSNPENGPDWPLDPGEMAIVQEDDPDWPASDPPGSSPSENSSEKASQPTDLSQDTADHPRIDKEALRELFSDFPPSD